MQKKLNIIYLATSEKGPAGGIKIIYSNCDIINNLKIKNVTSEILHIKKTKTSKWKTSLNKVLDINNSKYSGWSVKDIEADRSYKSPWWNKKNILIKRNFKFNKDKDFVIFPEIFAHFAKDLCINKKIPYGILVLNGYALNPTNDYKTLESCYNSSKFILSLSKNSNDCIKISFPKCKTKIFKAPFSIDKRKFDYKTKKSNIITYMPRKMPEHADNILFFLRCHISKKWKIKKLHQLKEDIVFNNLKKSKIFLSFNKSEGLGMPPIEAALAGNKVIGYTGEGGKEYWKKPIFTEIPNGNALKFVKEILKNTKKKFFDKKFKMQRHKLIQKYSFQSEKSDILKLIKLISKKI